MPKKSLRPSAADADAAPGGAAAVDRALSLLAAFRPGDTALSLATLAQRSRLYKSTVLRLLASLEHAGLVQRTESGGYTIGPEVARLNAIYSASFSVDAALLPVLRDLVAATQESAAFHVGRGEQRLCLLRVDSEQPLRDHVRAGDILPLARGAGGRVLLAFGGAKGLPYVQIRRDAVAVLHGDRVAGLTGIAAPVWGPGAALAGAITLTLPDQRMQPHFEAAVRAAAARATVRLGGAGPPPEPAAD